MSSRINRRTFIGSSTLAAAGILIGGRPAGSLAQDKVNTTISPAVPTTAGRIRGLVRFGVNQFWGVPYGASTAGANRFIPPQKVTAWTGVRDAFEVGHRAPQDSGGPVSVVWAMDRREADGEDCLNINIFTPGLNNGDRPVMVWLHGGGFSGGSGNWTLYDGTNLARKENVVVVAVTHRLNIFGFMHVAAGGEKYANSANVGMQDIVAVLSWIRDNIAAFGGNPGNVTIFGQSGGGGKVTTLMAMPSAKGLFHRVIAQSGSAMTGTPPANAAEGTERLMSKLGLKANQIDELQKMTWQQIQQAAEGVQGIANSPVIDGKILPRNQWSPTAPEFSSTVPLMMGSVETENGWVGPPPLELSDADMLGNFSRLAGSQRQPDEAKGRELAALYKRIHSGKNNQMVWLTAEADNSRRFNAQQLGRLKAMQAEAPSYLYFFNWQSPVYDNRMGAYHTLDIPFALYNVDIAISMTGSQQRRYPLAQKMSATWAAFARAGNPNNDQIPNWPAFNANQYPTMVLGDEVKLVNDPNREERLALQALRDARPTTQQNQEE